MDHNDADLLARAFAARTLSESGGFFTIHEYRTQHAALYSDFLREL